MLRRDWHAGELRILLLAMVIAVAGITSVNVFTDRIELALERQAQSLLGGDIVISSAHSMTDQYTVDAKRRNLRVARSLEFPSMVMVDDDAQLASIKVADGNYPLRGRLRIADELFGPDREVEGVPAAGTVWAESRLLTELNIGVGDFLIVGATTMKVSSDYPRTIQSIW